MIFMTSMKSKRRSDDPFYGSAKVGSRGQIVLPIEIRDKQNIREGDVLFVCEDGKHIKIMKSEVMKKVLEEIE